MIFNHIRFKVVVRLIIIASAMGVFLYLMLVESQYLRSVYFLSITIIGILELFWFMDRTNRDLTQFFEAILEGDFTTTFSKDDKGKSFSRLYTTLNKITEKFREIGADKEAQYHFLEMILQQVSVGVISFDLDGNVSIVNNSFRNLLGISRLTNIKPLKKLSSDLYHYLQEIKPEGSTLKKLQLKGRLLHLSMQASLIKIHNKEIKLVTIQNIKSELEAGEVEAWQRLIRVLAHEILNPITPITSLTDTMLGIMEKEMISNKNANQRATENIYSGLSTIKNRSQALNRFTQAYQSLTRLPKPEFLLIEGKKFARHLDSLFAPELKKKNIGWKCIVEPVDHEFLADEELMGQAVINLVRNSIDSFENSQIQEAKIEFIIQKQSEKTIISVNDNGVGIPEDKLDKIFIPFYTTRKNGSGIGLALARQIVRMHNGTLSVDSKTGEGTRFNIIT